MTYEEAFKYAIDTAAVLIDEEAAVAANQKDSPGVYSINHPLYGMLAFIYPNLFLETKRAEYDRIIDNKIRAQTIVRIRIKCLNIVSLAGKEFVDKVTKNEIDSIAMFSGLKDPRALRKELEEFFRLRPCTWFCILASSVYNNRLAANSKAVKNKKAIPPATQLGTGGSTRT